MLFIALVSLADPKSNKSSALPPLAFGMLCIYYAMTVWKRAARRSFSSRPELSQEFSVNVDESGINFDGQISKLQWTWQAFTKFGEANKLYLAYLSPCVFVILPKRVLNSNGTDELRALLQQHLSSK